MSADKNIKEDAEYRTGSTVAEAVDNNGSGDEKKKEEEDVKVEEEEEEEDNDDEGVYYEDDECDSCSSCSTVEADGRDGIQSYRRRERQASDTTAAAAEVTAFDLLDARRLPDLLDPGRLVAVLDECLGSVYVRGCVVETWDAVLSDHLDAIAHLVLYQTPEHAVSQTVYEQLMDLSAALRPPVPSPKSPRQRPGPEPARVDADRVYGTLRSAARSLMTSRVDACCRQSMCRAVGVAVVALRANTRPVFSVENFLVEINEAANFANLYCTAYAKRICAALKGIYDAVMAGEYHPTNVVVQMAVMEKSIRAALQTLADGRATAAQKTAAQRSLLAELDGVCATVRMKNHGCLQDGPAAAAAAEDRWTVAFPSRPTVHFTLSPWRAPIRMYHQQSPASADQLFKTTVRLVETLVSEIFKPCLNTGGPRRRSNGRRHRCDSGRSQVHEKRH